MTIKLDVPNLDDATIDYEEMRDFAQDLGRLSAYAENKALAMRYRSAGLIRDAQRYEVRCEMLYNLLPPKWRW